jgi:hypothetical protein
MFDITSGYKLFCDVFEPLSSRNTPKHDKTKQKRGKGDMRTKKNEEKVTCVRYLAFFWGLFLEQKVLTLTDIL